MAELVPLPGVGRKTANVVLGHAYGVNEGIAVDTHVHRVSNRLGLVDEDDPLKIEAQLMALVPRERWTRTTDLLIFHGRKVCDARRPLCGSCPIFALCAWESGQAWASGETKAARATRAPRSGARRRRVCGAPAASGRAACRAGPADAPAARAARPVGPMSAAPDRIVAAVVQMTSTSDVERNLAKAEELVTRAAARGARFVGLPENFGFLRCEGEPVPDPQPLDGPWVRRFAALARRLEITVLLGSLPEKIAGDGPTPESRVRNTSVLLGPDGATLAVYSKIHLFDVDLPGMEHIKESHDDRPGPARSSSPTPPPGRSGSRSATTCASRSSIRALSRRGARVLCVPAAFTERTGKAHWEVLLRARAIENLAYVLAPAQIGHHGPGRDSFGDALIVDPWGAVVARVPDGEDVALAELDFARLERLRRELPALRHARLLPPEG